MDAVLLSRRTNTQMKMPNANNPPRMRLAKGITGNSCFEAVDTDSAIVSWLGLAVQDPVVAREVFKSGDDRVWEVFFDEVAEIFALVVIVFKE